MMRNQIHENVSLRQKWQFAIRKVKNMRYLKLNLEKSTSYNPLKLIANDFYEDLWNTHKKLKLWNEFEKIVGS